MVARFALDGAVFSVGDAGRGEPRPYKIACENGATASAEKTPAGRRRYRDWHIVRRRITSELGFGGVDGFAFCGVGVFFGVALSC